MPQPLTLKKLKLNGSMKTFTACAAKLLHSYPTHCDPMDCNPAGSSVYGILNLTPKTGFLFITWD